MPLSTADLDPPARRSRGEASATSVSSSAPPAAATAAAGGALSLASESSDATVQNLLAKRQVAVVGGNAEAADAVTAELARLGYR